jgi:hypothetical protein
LTFILGSQGLFISRNVIPIAPLLLALFAIGVQVTFSKFSERYSFMAISARVVVCLLASAQLVLALYAFTQDLRPDSRNLAKVWIQQNVPITATIGTNESCFGQSPAKVAQRQTVSDPQMEKGFDFYVFDSYGGGVISSLFRDNEGGIALFEPKYLHYYHFNNREIYNALPSLLQQQIVPSIDGYEVIKIFRENGPEVWVWKRSG